MTMDIQDTNGSAQPDAEKTVVAQAANPEATLLGTAVTCPVCGTENAPGEKYCGDCGFLLSSTPEEAVSVVEEGEQARLVDPASGREFALCEGENTIGRESADILLSDPNVSRRHALLILEAGKCWIEDLGSTNGTYVGGEQVAAGERVEAADGAQLKFGSVILTLSLSSAEVAEVVETIEEAGEKSSGEETADEQVPPVAEAAIEEEPTPEVPAAARLVSTADPSSEYPIVQGTNTIGRRAGNDIVLSDAYASGSHAEIIADERGFWLMDVGSTNGTTLNGSKIEPNTKMAVSDGDEVGIGQTTLRFEVVEQAE